MRHAVFWVGGIFMLPFIAIGYIAALIAGGFMMGVKLATETAVWVKDV